MERARGIADLFKEVFGSSKASKSKGILWNIK